eukprot:GSMAST32.ASY1.ANO1.1781.1 assembled CDS
MVFTVCICGGGNGAHTAAGYLGSKPNIRVRILTRRPREWNKTIDVHTKGSSWESRGIITGKIEAVSSDPYDVVPGADLLLVAAPANVHPILLKRVAPFAKNGVQVASLYCQGGFDWAVQEAFATFESKISITWGLQNIPWICNLFDKKANYGKRVTIIGPKANLWVAAYPVERAADAAAVAFKLFDIPTYTLPNFLTLTLSPSNQIIHPPRYYSIFRDWDGKKDYDIEEIRAKGGMTLYADMDEFGAEQMQALDTELQTIKHALLSRFPTLDLSPVLPLGARVVKQYGKDVSDRSSLRQIFRSNRGYAGCATPMVKLPGNRVKPLVECRLFWEDIPYGLVVLKSLAQMMNVPTPSIDFYICWYQQFMHKEFVGGGCTLNTAILSETGAPERYNMTTIEEVVRMSLPMKNSRTSSRIGVSRL